MVVKGVRRFPQVVVWEITNACNLRCVHCEGSAGARDPEELTTEEALELCDQIAALGCARCNLSGGEPLLRRDWSKLAARLRERGVKVHLVTNGTFVTADVLAEAVEAGVVGVGLSLDGLKATHDRIRVAASCGAGSNFDRVVEALSAVKASGLKAGAITHINAWNLDELDGVYELLAELGADVWQVQLGFPEGRLLEIDEPYLIDPPQLEAVYQVLLRAMKDGRVPVRVTDTIGYYTELEPVVRVREHEKALPFWTGCYAGWRVMGIESNGGIKGCPSMGREFVIGNVRTERLADIWADEERFAYNTRWDESKLTGYCAECAYRKLCRAGCTTMAYAVTGTIYENPYCLHRVRATGGGAGMRRGHGKGGTR